MLALSIVILVAPACTRCEEGEEPVASSNPIRFDQLAVGQRSRYIGFEAEKRASPKTTPCLEKIIPG